MVATSPAFRNWLKQSTNMKLSSDASVLRITHEGVTDLSSLRDFDKDSIESLPRACSRAIIAVVADPENGIEAEPAVPASNVSTVSVHRLTVAANASRYYFSINRALTFGNMHYNNVLDGFKTDYAAYLTLKKQDSPDVPLISDKDKDKKVIKWLPLFDDAMSRTFGAKGPLMYVIRENDAVPEEVDDPLDNNRHYGASGSLLEELSKRLPHTGSIFRDDNKTVFMAISKAATGTSVESTIKTFSRTNNGRGAYFALRANHAGDIKYRAIVKSRMNLLTNIKWNGRSYPLETHISNHRQAADDLRECNSHINNQIPDESQRVEYLLDSISNQDSALQAAIGNIRADSNGMRSQFENSSAHMLEVDPYRRAARNQGKPDKTAQISDARFTAGRGDSGVDLRWHPRREFLDLSQSQKDELIAWQKSSAGKKALKKRATGQRGGIKREGDGNSSGHWKKKMKKAMKTPEGLAHIMSIMAEEEEKLSAYVSSLRSSLQPSTLPPVPAGAPAAAPSAPPIQVGSVEATYSNLSTKVKLQSILKRKN